MLTGITVAEIVNDFFEADDRNVLFYICDPKDGRMMARQRKFDYWFRLFNNNCRRIVADISTKSISVEVIFNFEKNNPFAYDLPLIIEDAKNNFNK